MPNSADAGRPSWDDENARRLVNRTIIVGITHLAEDRTVAEQRQVHGRIKEVDGRKASESNSNPMARCTGSRRT